MTINAIKELKALFDGDHDELERLKVRYDSLEEEIKELRANAVDRQGRPFISSAMMPQSGAARNAPPRPGADHQAGHEPVAPAPPPK
jgi:hypothetical protein